jgi:WD40 repeat protein
VELQLVGSIDAKDCPSAFGIQNRWFALWRKGGLFGSPKLTLHALADMQPIRTVLMQAKKPGDGSHSADAKYLAVDPLASRIAACWSADADMLAPAFGLNIHLYDHASNRYVAICGFPTRSPGRAGTVIAAFSPSGRMLAAPSPTGSAVHLIDVDSVLDPNRKARPVIILESVGSGGSLGIAWSPDGKLLAHFWKGLAGPSLEFWRLPNGDDPEHIQAENLGHVRVPGKIEGFAWPHKREVAFSPDSDLVAVGGLSKPNVLRLYSVARGEFVAESAPLDREGEVTSLTFSPDGLHVLSGHDRGSLVAWRLEGIDQPNLVMADSASLGGAIIGLGVDRDAQVLWIASRSNKRIDLHTAALPAAPRDNARVE